MRFAFYGLLLAVLVFVVTGGHLIFLPLFFALPVGGLFGHRRRYGTYRSYGGRGYGRRWP